MLGAVAAYSTGFPAMALIAFFTLLTLPALWQTRRVVRTLLADGVPPASLPAVLRMKTVLEVFERHALPMKKPQARILQAEAALRAVDTGSMRWRQRLALGLVYGLLVSVPLAGIGAYLLILRPSVATAMTPSPAAKVYSDALSKAGRQAAGMDIQALVRDLQRDADRPAPASPGEQEVAAAEARLGVRLPADLRVLYLASDGLPELQLAPLQQITRTGPVQLKSLLAGSTDGRLQIFVRDENAEGTQYWVTREQLSRTLKVGPPAGDDDDGGAMDVLLDLNDPSLVPGRYLIEGSGGAPLVALDLRHLLEQQWAQRQAQAAAQQEDERLTARRLEALRGEDMTQLLGHLPQPGLRERLLLHTPGPASPVDQATMAVAERKLGHPLPADLRSLLAVHDGIPRLTLVAAEHYVPVPKAHEVEALRPPSEAHGQMEFRLPGAQKKQNKVSLNIDALDGCAIVGAVAAGRPKENLDAPTILWCPQLTALGLQVLDLSREEAFPDFTALVRERVARQIAEAAP